MLWTLRFVAIGWPGSPLAVQILCATAIGARFSSSQGPESFEGRKVDGELLEALRGALAEEGAHLKIIAPMVGEVEAAEEDRWWLSYLMTSRYSFSDADAFAHPWHRGSQVALKI